MINLLCFFSFPCYNIHMKTLEVKIENLDHFGRGIARVDGKPIFIANSLVGEKLKVEIVKENKKIMEGKVIEYINYSLDRTKPQCPYYLECGGCDIMHINYNKQLEFKERKVKEVLKKFAQFENVKSIIGTEQFNYRNKVTLQVDKKIGYFKKKSNEIIEIDECLISDNRINDVIVNLQNIDLKNIKQIVIRTTKEEIMLVFYSIGNINIDVNKFNNVTTIIDINLTKTILKGKGYIVDNINDINYVISPTSFFQVNTCGMVKLYDKVLEYCKLNKNDKVLDLYCGTGTIGIYLSKFCNEVLGIEINEEAIKDAFINKKINNISNIDFKVGDVGKVLNNTKFNPDVVIVDPPRAGLDSNTIKHLIKTNSKKIIYVSCDVVTLSRDLKLLSEYYNIVEATPVDMFSNTYHVETVVLLEQKNCEVKYEY